MEQANSTLSAAFSKFINQAEVKNSLKSGNEVILSFMTQFPDSLPVFRETLAKLYSTVFYYSDSRNEYEICACGECLSLENSDLLRFDSGNERSLAFAEQKFLELQEKIVRNWSECCSEFIPLFVGGMKFNSKPGGEWSDYKGAKWFLPEVVIFKTNQSDSPSEISRILINFRVAKGEKISELLKKAENISAASLVYEPELKKARILLTANEQDPKAGERDWERLVSKGKELIATKDIDKVVFSRATEYNLNQEFSTATIISKIKNFKGRPDGSGCNGYLYREGKSVYWGCSPEKLFSVKGLKLETEAVAGSIARGVNDELDRKNEIMLLSSEKNIDEHNYVTRYIVNTLKKFSSKISYVKTPRIKKTAKVQHLWTPVTAELKGSEDDTTTIIPVFKLISSLFPTPAVCGFPREVAFRIINEYENIDRGLFTGIVGWFNFYSANIAVSIRGGLQRNNKLTIYAGCGIVEDSSPETEYEETLLKMNNILTIIDYENQ